MKVEYDSNNSGGSWWLKEADWVALEKAGWCVEWGSSYFCHSEWASFPKPPNKPEPCATKDECHGHRRFDTLDECKAAGDKGLWLGAYAKTATLECSSLAEAIRSWESVTGREASDEGCNCCGAPHTFKQVDAPKGTPWEQTYVSGADVIGILYAKAPKSLREAAEQLSGKGGKE